MSEIRAPERDKRPRIDAGGFRVVGGGGISGGLKSDLNAILSAGGKRTPQKAHI